MANCTGDSCVPPENTYIEELIYEAISGWVSYLHIKKSSRGELRTSCDHLASLSSDLAHIPKPHTPCQVCQDPDDNVLCLCCKGVFCSRLVNKHNQEHRGKTDHCLEFVYRGLSFRCMSCHSYLDAQAIEQLRPVYIKAYIQKFALKGPSAAALQRKIQTSSSCSAVQSFDNKEDKSCPIKTNPSQTNKSCNEEITFLNRKCKCGETADLKISESKENPNKLTYCCPKKGDGCNFLAMWERDDPACSIVGGSSSKQEICLNFKNDAAPIPDIGAPTSNPRILERIVALEANVAAGKMVVLFNFLVVFLGLFVMVCVLVKF
ncbi:uncharacterized protein LOC21400283 isoform X1 [Morus notabilis]|uniref:uncharacterized protein LOC21400283 isoform X1 n=1 Tax=Morus notabilis TaxID=981085 RepID=UPI000CECF911|nr:uncharacterized protein LOC21400283 isoform X1 [Morus notabilis]